MARRGRPRAPIDPTIRTPEEMAAWRVSRGLSQQALADQLAVHKQSVYRWEAGAVPIPQMVEYALRYLGARVPAA